MAVTSKSFICEISAALLVVLLASPALGQVEPRPVVPDRASPAAAGQVNTIRDVFKRLFGCWRPPSAAVATPMDITVIVSFNRSGAIMGHPRITYESPKATDNDRLAYRVAVMEALQRCSPMPFTESMAGAVAGRPFAVEFRTHLKSQEKRAWLSPKIL
jgi:hypothetical protein